MSRCVCPLVTGCLVTGSYTWQRWSMKNFSRSPTIFANNSSRVASAGMSDRIHVVAGDALSDELPGGHDVVLVANLARYWSTETNVELLRRIRVAVSPGAHLLLADFWTDPTHTQPLLAALLAGEFAVHL
jgi:chemotaxis methyl-accepting protein methylase